jgi:Spy/CpxP family protein refolding chaperone
MRPIWILVLGLSLGLNAGLLYREFATGHGDHRGRRTPPTAEEIVKHRLSELQGNLALTPDQEKSLRAILEETIPRVMAQSDSVRRVRARLAGEYAGATIDTAAVRAALDQMNAAQASLDSTIAESLLREASLLTPEQRVQYVEHLPWRRHASRRP